MRWLVETIIYYKMSLYDIIELIRTKYIISDEFISLRSRMIFDDLPSIVPCLLWRPQFRAASQACPIGEALPVPPLVPCTPTTGRKLRSERPAAEEPLGGRLDTTCTEQHAQKTADLIGSLTHQELARGRDKGKKEGQHSLTQCWLMGVARMTMPQHKRSAW